MRAGFFKGVWRRLLSVPRLVICVRGWPWVMADSMGVRRQPYRVASGGVGCELRPGASDWWIFLEIFVFGIYRRVQEDIRRSKVIIDVGANVGFFGLHAAALNPEADVHAFEPFPKNVEQMKRNLRLNPPRRIHIHPEAVSDRGGTVTLYFSPGDDSGCSLSQSKDHSCSVKAVGINELFESCGVTGCDLLKMDCEGSELPILRAAAPELLARIRSIIMEYHNPAEVDPLLAILAGSGFRCEVLSEIKTLYASRG